MERYTEAQAMDEAAEMRKKIERGEAKSYEQAEKIIDRERSLSRVRVKMEELKRTGLDEAEESLESGEIRSLKERKPTKEEIDDARKIIADFLSAQEYPKVTVTRKRLGQILKEGLREHATAYQKDVQAIIGTIGREPFLPEDGDRVILEIRLPPGKIDPRFTGEANLFDGIVRINERLIPPEAINVIDPKEKKAA